MQHNFTLVTGLWDMGRSELKDFGRSFDHYKEQFEQMLSLDFPMHIYIPKQLVSFVEKRRKGKPTYITVKEIDEFKDWFPFYKNVQTIRKNRAWYSQAAWLENSPQAKLEYYNPVVMSKFFMLNDTSIGNVFKTDYFFWIDAGLTNTVAKSYLENMSRLPSYMSDKKFVFLSYPYENTSEIHGFRRQAFEEILGEQSKYVCRGGFFGGSIKEINQLNNAYYGIANDCFNRKEMGTEENFLTILSHRYKDDVTRFELDWNGLVYPFFENLGQLPEIKTKSNLNHSLVAYDKRKDIDDIKTSLYVLTYNKPNQFKQIAKTWIDNGFDKCRKILINNSTDPSTYEEYSKLCKEYGFEHIKKQNNIGICGGRMFVAQHFDESDSEYYVFVEDDMFLNYEDNNPKRDRKGFDTYIEKLYEKSLAIIHKNRYDFLKLTYSEFFGDNSVAWSWYNVPQLIREQYFPDRTKLPEHGLDPDPPKVVPTNRKRYKDLYYLEGPYHYCNWPIWISREGNYKIFLETTWERPYEQTWMSHVFQKQMKDEIKSAVLELSPITHDRFEHYNGEERIES